MNLSTAEFIRSINPEFKWLNRQNKSEIKKVYEQELAQIKEKIQGIYLDKAHFNRTIVLWHDRWFLEYAHDCLDQRLGFFNGLARRYEWILKSLKGVKNPSTTLTPLDIDRAKSIPLATLYGEQFRSVAGRLTGRCPFHSEKTGSFVIYQDNHYHCFGCGEHGDAIDYIMKTKELKFLDAVRFLLGK